SIKIKLFLPLCLASQGLFPSLRRSLSPPPTPHPHRKSLEREGEKPRRTPTPNRPPRPTLNFDEDDENNKENLPPPEYEEEQQGAATTLHQLLRKWEVELDRFRDTVIQDLDAFKKRLGIRH
ncbi:^E4, partial [Gammapapillomavirus 12]